MARDPNIPDSFDVYTVVVLRRPADAQSDPLTEGPVGERRSMPDD